ncbi:MAG TPA: PP2C family serine/threonine-protein phosphatase [Chloroflexia bacterium]
MSTDPTPTPPNDTERQQAETANGSDAVAQATPGLDAGVSSEPVAASSSPHGPSTTPLAVVEVPASTSTTPLPGLGGPPSPPLELGTMLGGRYEVVLFMHNLGNTNIYRVLDQQGFRRCWACGSTNSAPGDMYCVECGAQLSGRYYRAQEFSVAPGEVADDPTQTTEELDPNPQPEVLNPDANLTIPVPEAILANRVLGVVQASDAIAAPELGRVYVVWEEAYGRTLSSWLPDAGADIFSQIQSGQSGQLSIEEPSEEQSLAWMAQSAEILANLHAEGILGCNMGLNNLLVQVGDRVLLLDPSGCRQADANDTAAAQASDVRALAGELEHWYMSVRKDTGALTMSSEEPPATAGGNGKMMVASEFTGPLANMLNPAVALAKAREGSLPTAAAFSKVLREIYEASRPLRNLQLLSGRATDVGRVRQVNEDSVLTFEATVLEHEGGLPVGLYVVADGMGGHQSGEVASSIAVRTIVAVVNSSLIGPMLAGDPVACDPNTCMSLLRQAIMEANRRISDLARERHSDLGTTAVAAILVGNQLCVANVGDSRAYFWQEGQLTPITRDHSLVAQLVAAGQIKPDDIYTHPRRNEIYRALGESRLVDTDVDVFTRRLQPGDGLLVCSDGLWDFVRDPNIAATINTGAEPQSICHTLIDLANQGGGEDNISAIYVRVVSAKRSQE